MVRTHNPADIVLLLDGSGSINDGQFQQQLRAGDLLLDYFQKNMSASQGSPELRAGVVQYSGECNECFGKLTANAAKVEVPLTSDVAEARGRLSVAGGNSSPIRQFKKGTYFGPALAKCYFETQQRGRGDATKLCVLMSDGKNQDGLSDSFEYQKGDSSGGYEVCRTPDKHTNLPCAADTIAMWMKGQGYKIVGIVVGNDATAKQNMKVNYASEPYGINFIDATDFGALQARVESLASSLTIEVGSNTQCLSNVGGLGWLLLVLPILVYLFLQCARRFCVIEEDGPPVPGADRGGAAGSRASKKYRWSLKAADHYLWNMEGGGARPLHVDFGDKVPPSAPKQDDKTMVRREAAHYEKGLFEEGVIRSLCSDLFCRCCRRSAGGGGGDGDDQSHYVRM